MQTNRRKRGFTLAETLIVVAIVVILAALAFAFLNPRSMTIKQYDDYSKEIFIAAQNHLALAESLNYLGRSVYGTGETAAGGEGGAAADSGVYYFAVNATDSLTNQASVLNLMLPNGSIDETLRGGGQYIVRYQPASGLVLDVFYWETEGRYPHKNYSAGDYADFMGKRNNKAALRNLESDHSVIGYYGGVTPDPGKAVELVRPQLWVENGDTLTVHITDTNTVAHKLKLIVMGAHGGGPKEFTFDTTHDEYEYEQVLDDITDTQLKFSFLVPGVTPGDDLSLRAVVIDNNAASNVVASDEVTCNSLFADSSDYSGKRADIANIRHLENLSPDISGVSGYTSASQLVNLDWDDFIGSDLIKSANIFYGNLSEPTGHFHPVTTGGALAYDGGSHMISNVKVEVTGADAGLFGTLKSGSTVKDLRLSDFDISGSNAGALAGTAADGTSVSNVLACVDFKPAVIISGTTSAGGLIGSASGCSVTNSGAAMTVSAGGSGAAGGLIGTAADTSILRCMAGGQTTDGKYSATAFNVDGGSSAGGLVGSITGGSVMSSYSTCSATGTTVGGLLGTASGTTVNRCYATGLVSGTTAGAFSGTAIDATECFYYEIINETKGTKTVDGVEITVFDYLTAFPGGDNGVGKLDADVTAYNAQFAGTTSALPYDVSLALYFAGKYPLKTVFELDGMSAAQTDYVAVHHGDWPAPETLIINRHS